MKRCSNRRSCFLAIMHQRCYHVNDPNDARGHKSPVWANQIASFHFARVIYDAFNETAMLAAVWLTISHCTFVLATVSHNYIDFDTIKIDAYINSRHAHADAITSDQQRQINSFDVVRATLNEADGKCFSFVTSDLLPRHALHDIYENRC